MINKALKIIRQFHNVKQVELAQKLNLSKSYLSEIESGKKPVNLELLDKYSNLFDIPVSSLVFFSETIGKEGKNAQKFRYAFADKILNIMEWMAIKNESKKV
ncbi:helix-turn-helix domain-containing protein [Photobacterium profundum]|nr:helix-turn-helix transcriptional regulator [Photobacterium profundum]